MPHSSPTFRAEHFINRELSWLAFNERVLEEASRPGMPVLERAKFLAITASNLDEFYMVRVGGLQLMREQGLRAKDTSGLTVTQQLDQIRERTTSLIARQYEILNGQILSDLRTHGVRRLQSSELTPLQRTLLQDYFLEHIHPVLSPIEIDPEKLPSLPALQIVLLCLMASEGNPDRQVMIVLPSNLPRHVTIADSEAGAHHYMNIEDVVELFLHHFLPGEQIKGIARFRLSRNSDIAVDDKSALDLASEMEEILDARRLGATIRIEIEQGAPRILEKTIRSLAPAKGAMVFTIPGELDLRAYFILSSLPGFEKLKVDPWESQSSTAIDPGESLFAAIQRRDILLHHPYESFEPVVQLVEEAASDPEVVAIKQILYRTAKKSRLISALIKAAESGKHVTVLVELKARFDEARNLERAEELLGAGAQIIYGVRGLKTHAKVCLIMRREGGRMVRYMHFGTGNYNEATAKLYTDISYLTCRPEYGSDASAFFNTVTGRSRFQHFEKLSMAPFGLRERLLAMITSETDRAKQGEQAEITLKMNALEDREMIEALYAASQAGVKIRLNVRGICCLKPGVKGISENIRVVSIIDRYLEHARIFSFRQGGTPVVFIASADFMNRNLSKRVELLIPIEDAAARKRLVAILETFFNDNVKARLLGPDGSYRPVAQDGNKPFRAQESFAKDAAKRAKQHTQTPDTLVPHLPKAEA